LIVKTPPRDPAPSHDGGVTEIVPLDQASALAELAPRILYLFANGDLAPVALADGPVPTAWVLPYSEFDRLARYRAWAACADRLAGPAEQGERELAQYDRSVDTALTLAAARPLPAGVGQLQLDQFVGAATAALDAVVRQGRPPVAFGTGNRPEAVLVSAAQYDELRTAELRWHQSEPFLDALPAEDFRPMPESRRYELDELFAELGPDAIELWDEIQREEGNR